MGACATKPKVKADDMATIPAPEPVDHDMVKNTEEVKVVEEERNVDQNDEKKKEDNEKVVVEEEKPPSLASLLVEVYTLNRFNRLEYLRLQYDLLK